MVCGYVLLFLLDIKTEDMSKRTFNVRLAAVWERLFTWLSLVMPLVVCCFVLSFFPQDDLDENRD